MNKIGEIKTERYSLIIYECSCGFHIGLDSLYIATSKEGDSLHKCLLCGKDMNTYDAEYGDDEISSGC